MAMDKYGVEQKRRMQQTALDEVRAKLVTLRTLPHVKTAEENERIAILERQERELAEALQDPE